MDDRNIDILAGIVSKVVIFCVTGVILSLTISVTALAIWFMRWVVGVLF